MQYALLFLEGIVTFISPCLLPLLPVYISFFASGGQDGGRASRGRTAVNALGFVLGFTLVFVALGAFAGTLGAWLTRHQTAVNLVSGGVVIILGLSLTGALNLRLPGRPRARRAGVKPAGFLSAVLFGAVFSVGWTPCVGAFLGSALMMASARGGTLTGSLMLLTYSLGLGIPFVLSALLIDGLKGAFALIKRNYRVINAVSGLLLVAVGILMASGLMGKWLALLTF